MEKRKKYYFLVNSLEGGGAERVILRVASNLSKSAIVHIITIKNESFYDLPEGVIWKPLSNTKNNLLMSVLFPYFAFKLRKLLKAEGYDNGISFLEISNFVHILAKKNATISLRVNLDYFRRPAGAIYLMLVKLLYPKAGKIVVNSYENALELQNELALPEEKIVTIHNPIDIAAIEKSLETDIELPGNSEGKTKYITIGRIVWQKHHEDIIMTLSGMKKSGNNNFIYYIIGDGDGRAKMEELVAKENLKDEIIFLGSQKNVFAYLKKCDYFLYASEAEGFPNVLLEAIAVGIPIITTDFKTGAREVIYGTYKTDIKLPQIGPNGALLRPRKFQEDFIAISPKINTVKQEQVGLDGYKLEKIAQSFAHVLENA